jgi:hypothetical protein
MVRVLVMSLLVIALDHDEIGTHTRRDAASVGEAECRGGGTGRGGQSRGRGQTGLHEKVEFIVQAGAVGGARTRRIGAGEQA